MYESRFQAQPRSQSLTYVCCGAAVKTGRFDTFFQPKFPGWGENEPQFLRDWETELSQILGAHRTVIGAPPVILDFRCTAK